MSCLRCHGFVCRERFNWRGHWWLRCINCGDRVDAVILRHRAEQEADAAIKRAQDERDMKEWSDWFSRVPA